ncbi:hypothetical protein HDU67_008938 [Dinochytrium kinnereticum]|nr:hypothetical protein HDU67_008938 [Dinochytrium kinnereticum]
MVPQQTNVPNLNRPTVDPPKNYPIGKLSEEELSQLEELKDRRPLIFGELEGTPLPGEEVRGHILSGILDNNERQKWADDACLLRYLRATKWDAEAAAIRLRKTLQWRREYRPTEISPEEVEPESVTGKQFVSGFDKIGRPLYFLVPRNENTKTYERQLRYVVYNLEKGIALMPYSVEQFTLVIDYENMSMMNSTPLHVSKKFLEIVGDHYPERLGQAFMINPSWYLWVFFKLLGPFLDPVTKSKIHFVNVLKQREMNASGLKEEHGTAGWTNILFFVDADQLPTAYGGTYDFVFSHETYWKHFTAVKPA